MTEARIYIPVKHISKYLVLELEPNAMTVAEKSTEHQLYGLDLSSTLISVGGCNICEADACAKVIGEGELDRGAVVSPFLIARTESTMTASIPLIT